METIENDMILEPFVSTKKAPICVHGTYLENIDSIQRDGLNHMKRNHIHFARDLPSDGDSINGMQEAL